MPKSGGKRKNKGRRSPHKNNTNKRSPQKKQPHQNGSSNTNKNTQSQDPPTPAMQLKTKGNAAFGSNDYDTAIDFYTRAIELETDNHTLYSNRSAAYQQCHKYELALKDANKCIELQPDWVKGYIRKGTVYSNLNKFSEADAVYKLGIQKCDDKDSLTKALEQLKISRMNTLNRADKVVGGHHAQAQKFRKLINWLQQGGAKFPKLFLKFYSPEYRAIHAMARIEKDEDICYIPHDFIMTSDVAKASVIGQEIIESKVELRSKHSYLASYLLQEREKEDSSSWHVYISILPRKFETIPLFFDSEQRKELIGSISLKKIDDRLESLRLEYEALCGAVPSFIRFCLEDFIWARLVVITRIFGLVINDVKTDGLVPMADMLNHRRPRETKWTYSQKKRGFLITSLQNIGANAEIFDSYGRKCNSRFFVNYGFSLEYNADNEALMTFSLQKNDAQYAIKSRQLGCFSKDFQIQTQYKEKKVKECFSWLRIAHAQGNEFLIISSINKDNNNSDIPPLSIRNETNVLTTLAVSATRSLQKFQGSLKEDNELLADEDRYPRFANDRNAVLMRRGEKQVLTFYINLCKICVQLFKMKFKDLRQKLKKDKKFRDQESAIMQYVNHVVIPLVQRRN